MQMIRGGTSSMGKSIEGNQTAVAVADEQRMFDVAMVDVVSWIRASFAEEDFVVLKMDIEGDSDGIATGLLL